METTPRASTEFLWLEITGKCQLACTHCYADSGPTRNHGIMTTDDWQHAITDAATLGAHTVQFIGGEPTTHPAFTHLLAHAIDTGMAVEVFSHLAYIKDAWWDLLSHPSVSLATSYYSDTPAEHGRITGRPGAHARTRANIRAAVQRGIPIRVGIIDVADGQRVERAEADLMALGVTAIGYDRLRAFGRGSADGIADEADSCGHCGDGRAAIGPDGTVWPCVMTRHAVAGNIRDTPLADIVNGPVFRGHVERIAKTRRTRAACSPLTCSPDASCGPNCFPSCSPCGVKKSL